MCKISITIIKSQNYQEIFAFFVIYRFSSSTSIEKSAAITIWGEHRYFGKSIHFGDDSLKKKNLAYLTVEQAMNDFVEPSKESNDY